MRRIAMPSLGAWAVALLLGLAAQQASANQLSVSNRSFRAVWSAMRMGASGSFVSCAVTLEGSFHSNTIVKTPRSLIGYVVRASLGGCTGGTATVLTGTLPWHVQYDSFTGTLPNITSVVIRVVGLSAQVAIGGVSCLYGSTTASPVRASATLSSGRVTALVLDERAVIPKASGSFLCPSTGQLSGSGSLSLTGTTTPLSVTLLGGRREAPDPVVVTVGDSFIAGEGGRWASNTAELPSTAIDRLGASAYYDDAGNTGETIRLCHRSKSAEAHIGALINVLTLNLACSGARTETFINGEGDFKPGLDFYEGEAGRGQALMLREFAEANPGAIKLVAISIGGNDFGFGDIIEACVTNFIFWGFGLCSEEAAITERINEEAVATHTEAIANGILAVRRAMERAGYADETYTLLIQDYPSPIPSTAGLRYSGASKWEQGGCPIFDPDIDWANGSVLPTVNETVWAAVAATGLTNIVRLELLPTFNGRRLCEGGVGLLEEKEMTSWSEPDAIDETEWITQIRILPPEPFSRQEGFHPNYWGQKALRSCLRLAYNEGTPIEGTCQIAGSGKTALEEPRMRLN